MGKKYAAKFKVAVGIEAIKEKWSVNEVALEYGIPPEMVERGRRILTKQL